MSTLNEQYGGDHYKKMAVQPWQVISTWPLAQQIGFYRGNALKYLMRAGSKDDPLQEIQKARHYLDRLIEVLGDKNDSRSPTAVSMAQSPRQVYADVLGRKQNESGCCGACGSVQTEQDPARPAEL